MPLAGESLERREITTRFAVINERSVIHAAVNVRDEIISPVIGELIAIGMLIKNQHWAQIATGCVGRDCLGCRLMVHD